MEIDLEVLTEMERLRVELEECQRKLKRTTVERDEQLRVATTQTEEAVRLRQDNWMLAGRIGDLQKRVEELLEQNALLAQRTMNVERQRMLEARVLAKHTDELTARAEAAEAELARSRGYDEALRTALVDDGEIPEPQSFGEGWSLLLAARDTAPGRIPEAVVGQALRLALGGS